MVAETNLEGSSRHMAEGAAPHRSWCCLAPADDGDNRPENAGVMVAAASAGDTNAALHPRAVARRRGITFDLSDVAKAFKGTPCIADLKPTGRFVAKNLFETCSVPMPTKTLLDNGFVHGDCMTVSEYRMAENLKCMGLEFPPYGFVRRVARARRRRQCAAQKLGSASECGRV